MVPTVSNRPWGTERTKLCVAFFPVFFCFSFYSVSLFLLLFPIFGFHFSFFSYFMFALFFVFLMRSSGIEIVKVIVNYKCPEGNLLYLIISTSFYGSSLTLNMRAQ